MRKTVSKHLLVSVSKTESYRVTGREFVDLSCAETMNPGDLLPKLMA